MLNRATILRRNVEDKWLRDPGNNLISCLKIQNDRFEILTVKMNTSVVAHAVIWMLMARDSLFEKSGNAAVYMRTSAFAVVSAVV